MRTTLLKLSALALLAIPATLSGAANAQQFQGADVGVDVPAKDDGTFPLGGFVGISNSFSNGILQKGDFQVPGWFTSIPMGLSWRLVNSDSAAADYLPPLTLSANTSVSMSWLSTAFSGNFGAGDRIPRIGDLTLGLGTGNLWKASNAIDPENSWTRLNVTTRASLRLPVSLASRTNNVIAAGAFGLGLSWQVPKLPIFFSYSPTVAATAYSQDSRSVPCDTPSEFNTGLFGTGDPARDTVGIPIRIPRAAEVLPNGECRLVGRQSLASFNQNVSIRAVIPQHSLSVSFGYGMAFLRPIAADEFTPKYATGQNFSDFTSGSVSYGYDIPDELLGISDFVNTSASFTLSSGQPPFTFDGKALRFPFWDFVSPNNNFSSATVSLSASF